MKGRLCDVLVFANVLVLAMAGCTISQLRTAKSIVCQPLCWNGLTIVRLLAPKTSLSGGMEKVSTCKTMPMKLHSDSGADGAKVLGSS